MKYLFVVSVVLLATMLSGCHFPNVKQFDSDKATSKTVSGGIVLAPSRPIDGANGLYRVPVLAFGSVTSCCTSDGSLRTNDMVVISRVRNPYTGGYGMGPKEHAFDWAAKPSPQAPEAAPAKTDR